MKHQGVQNATFDENLHENERIVAISGCANSIIAYAKHRCTGGWLKLWSEGTWTSSYHLDAMITETYHSHHGSRASCQIRKFAGSHAPGMSETFSTPSRVSDPDMHHGTCVIHVPWCMPESLTHGGTTEVGWFRCLPPFLRLTKIKQWSSATTEEGNYSYLLSRAAAAGAKRTKYAKFPCMKSREFWCIEWVRLDLSWVQIMGT